MPAMPISAVGSSRANRISLQPLARPDAGEGDLDVAAGLEAGQPDHALGEIDDLHRLAHVEHIDRRRPTRSRPERMARRRDHEVAGLADGHEVAHHVRMRDGDRPAGLDLRLELRHHRAVRREHIAEAHRDQPHRRSCRRRRGARNRRRAPGNTFRRSAWWRRAPTPARSPCRSRSSPWRRRRPRPRHRRH